MGVELLPHEQRVVEERDQLLEKINKLDAFIETNPIFKTLSVGEQGDQFNQRASMLRYAACLDSRIARFTDPSHGLDEERDCEGIDICGDKE